MMEAIMVAIGGKKVTITNKLYMNIGFLMGSFDPIHIGHINMIRLALNSGLVDKVIVVPSVHNPWKKDSPAPFEFRKQIIEASITQFKGLCEVSDAETMFDPPHYSYKVLNHFKEVFKNDKLFIICGADTTVNIQNWKNAEDIIPHYGVIEIARNGEKTNGVPYLSHSINTFMINVSSTEIRSLIRNGKLTYPLLTEGAIDIINRNNLYR